jgi:arylsulfatase A-like enzyme
MSPTTTGPRALTGRRLAPWLAAAALAASAGPQGGAGAAPVTAKSPPNIVVVMTDDLDTSVYQQALAMKVLPNIQANLVDKGTSYNQMFVALSVCCPSRTTFLTGQYPHNHGVIRNVGPEGGFEHFDNDGDTVATWLHGAGYRTGIVGKYLNGYGSSEKDQHGKYIPPGWDTWWALFSVGQFNYSLSNQGVRQHYGDAPADYQTDVVSGVAQNFLNSSDPRPFFLLVTPTAPHYEGSNSDDDSGTGLRPPPRYANVPPLLTIPTQSLPSFNEADMSDKPVFMRSQPFIDPAQQVQGFSSKVQAMRAVDDMVGAIFQVLATRQLLGNTVVIFTSDNGFQYGTHRRTQKTDLYEESIRVPLVIRGAGQTKASSVDDWVMNTDWAPTVADLAGVGPAPPLVMDGRSLVPTFGGAGNWTPRRTLLVEHPSDGIRAAGHPPYFMVRSKDPAITDDPAGKVTLIYAETYDNKGNLTDKEFYDLSTDPWQLASLQGSTDHERQSQMARLATRLGQLRSCAGGGCRSLEN